ncbi:MFS transporter [Sediminibacterium ginsengisoli]|uniref:Predicted arabinose efflux permease, MFS family n=1 Tax=Sediminibacterium ginsengisoli TaxID=413434 RepID=A0A1T4RF91_9BACT|nr:MFS transporter [Sediminibacterium ginsengisoli]SKA14603.1 Predicted arabinose efflux permease, MFS family [Sediminibacterium ginsengisoli]
MKRHELSSMQVIVMAIAAGICVANIYYNQPILQEMAAGIHATAAEIGTVPVLSQAGYGLGLFFLTPLGDKMNRKKLILLLQGALILVLLAMTLVQHITGLYFMSLLIGLGAVSAQVILPMAAAMAGTNRGKVVGIVFTGILVGILLARVFSGYITAWFGWRSVYGISAAMVFLAAGMIWFAVPDQPAQFKGNYGQLLQSTLLQVKRFSLLRRTALLGALVFGAFCSFWTTLTFHLSGPPFQYHSGTIGLFGMLAVGGALLAPLFGRLSDKGNPGRFLRLTVLLLIAGILLIHFFPYNITCFIIAVLLLDIGVQATQVTNLATIYTLDATAHSRINTVYMTVYFIGGALGTLAGVQCWRIGGWHVVTMQLLLWSGLALLLVMSGKIARSKK